MRGARDCPGVSAMAPGNMALESLNTVLGTVFMIWSKRTASSFFGGGHSQLMLRGHSWLSTQKLPLVWGGPYGTPGDQTAVLPWQTPYL